MRSAILLIFFSSTKKEPFFLGIICIAISFVAMGVDLGFMAMESACFSRGGRNVL